MKNNGTVTIWKFSAQNYQQILPEFQIIDKSVIFKLIWYFFHHYYIIIFFRIPYLSVADTKLEIPGFCFHRFFIVLSLLYNVFE